MPLYKVDGTGCPEVCLFLRYSPSAAQKSNGTIVCYRKEWEHYSGINDLKHPIKT